MKRTYPSRTLGLSLPLVAASLISSAHAQTVVPVAATTVVNPAVNQGAANGVAAEVNGEKIMISDLNRQLEAFKQEEPSLATGTPAAAKALASIKTQILEELINTTLLAQEAKKQKIVPDPKVVADTINGIKAKFKSDAEFKTWLDGKTVEDVRKTISDDMAIRELSERMTSDVVVSNDDIATFYRANLDQFTIPESVKARHILLAINPNAPDAQKEAVKKRAMDLIKQLNAKADFAALAKANSDDQTNKNQGGDLGQFGRGQMVKAFDEAVFAAPVGKIIGPIQTDYGLHIIRVDEKIPAKVIPLPQIQQNPQVKAILLKDKVQKRLDENIAKLRKAAKITNNLA